MIAWSRRPVEGEREVLRAPAGFSLGPLTKPPNDLLEELGLTRQTMVNRVDLEQLLLHCRGDEKR